MRLIYTIATVSLNFVDVYVRFNGGTFCRNALHKLDSISISFNLFRRSFDGISAKFMESNNEYFFFWTRKLLLNYLSKLLTFMKWIQMFIRMLIFHNFGVFRPLNKFIPKKIFKIREYSNNVSTMSSRNQSCKMRTRIFNSSRY